METRIPNKTLLSNLPLNEPQICKELKKLNETVAGKKTRNVIVNFAKVQILNSSSLSNLLILYGILKKRNGKLVLCSVPTITKYIFVVAGLDKVFCFADDKQTAFETIAKKV